MEINLKKVQQYLDWVKTMIYLSSIADRSKTRVVKRGEVYNCYLGRGIGSEEEKFRPVIILQNNDGNLHSGNTIVAPITNSPGTQKVTVPITGNYIYTENGVNKKLAGYILLGNIVTVSKARLKDYLVTLKDEMPEVNEKIMVSLGIYKEFKKLKDKVDKDKRFIERILKENRELSKEVNRQQA